MHAALLLRTFLRSREPGTDGDPRSLTFADAAAEIAEAAGREVRYVPITLEEHAAEAAAHGVPPEVVDLLTYLFKEVVDGRNANTTDGVADRAGAVLGS